MKKLILFTLVLLVAFSFPCFALNLARVKTWGAEVLTFADLNAEFDNVLTHSITNADVSATAAIVGSKLDLSVPGAIGGTTPAAGAFTTLGASGTLSVTGAATLGSTVSTGGKLTAGANEIEGSAFDINGGTVDDISSLTALGNLDIGAHQFKALIVESDQATGTAGFKTASTTVCTNLNADLLDGYSYNETEIKPLGTWASKNVDTAYLAATDGFVTAVMTNTGYSIIGYTDDSNPPTTERVAARSSADAGEPGFTMPVKKGDYYEIVENNASATQDIYWIPLGA